MRAARPRAGRAGSGRTWVRRQRRPSRYAGQTDYGLAFAWHIGNCALNRAEAGRAGWVEDASVAMVFAAFAFEGCLNHICDHLFEKWPERALWHEKLRRVRREAGLRGKPDWSTLPYRSIEAAFAFRNGMAHPRTVYSAKVDDGWGCTIENARAALRDVKAEGDQLLELLGCDLPGGFYVLRESAGMVLDDEETG